MTIIVESRRKQAITLKKLWPTATILDMTSKAEEPWVRFSPFYPHGGIPIPNSHGVFAQSVEGLWQGLKVFEHEDIDQSKWAITTMSGIKRAGKSRGPVIGHRLGVGREEILGYHDARLRIYLPAYKWVLENRLVSLVEDLRQLRAEKMLVFLDYETNGDVANLSSPLSHAALIKYYLDDSWPSG